MNECLECKKETENPSYCSKKCSAKNSHKRKTSYSISLDNARTKDMICSLCHDSFTAKLRSPHFTLCPNCKRSGHRSIEVYGSVMKKCQFCSTLVKSGKYASAVCTSPQCKQKYCAKRKSFFEASDRGLAKARQTVQNKILMEDAQAFQDLPIPAKLRRIQKRGKCEICGVVDWNGGKLTLQIHHTRGRQFEELETDFQLLCPNCHSQTDNFCFKGRTHSKESRIKLSKNTHRK